ncbi:hypothetical protein CDG81_02695 [Actinopolyspora erythraea]|uniref:Type II toxin-antitoxin system RelE/ParE family toxin n=2 Tax=Actinopolyspora TaxID=1849 RepID=A0A099CZZ6_9ACTN|nr:MULTISPECIES: hypothetical protein [Actinopolyspora]ASU77390.1 hypothetical protein CDG81_02695 [Actinopolyspora erythraea]KGI79291.1 hypothetical protein IL38_24460 [Actinopolyspora erythraea]SDO99254.1 hypothetical protein SAMN04487905_101364 [Actinopolyspora xinjiangensis]
MSRYNVQWADVPREAYSRLPPERRKKVDRLHALLTSDPISIGDYNRKTDQWTTTTDDGRIMLVYIVHEGWLQVRVLRQFDV